MQAEVTPVSNYRIDTNLQGFHPPFRGEFFPFSVSVEFMQQLKTGYVVVAIHAPGDEFSSRFKPAELYSVPLNVFIELMKNPAVFSELANGRFVQFFYLNEGDAFQDSREPRDGQPRLELEAVVHGIPLSLFWDLDHRDYVIYCEDIRVSGQAVYDAETAPENCAPDQLVRISDDEAEARAVFEAVCKQVSKDPAMSLREVYQHMERECDRVTATFRFSKHRA